VIRAKTKIAEKYVNRNLKDLFIYGIKKKGEKWSAWKTERQGDRTPLVVGVPAVRSGKSVKKQRSMSLVEGYNN